MYCICMNNCCKLKSCICTSYILKDFKDFHLKICSPRERAGPLCDWHWEPSPVLTFYNVAITYSVNILKTLISFSRGIGNKMNVQINTYIQPSELCIVQNLIIFSITIFVPNSANPYTNGEKKKKELWRTSS